MANMSAKDQYIALLGQHKHKFRTVSAALQLLSNKYESGLTIAGGMIPSQIALCSQPKVLWMTVEFGVIEPEPEKISKVDRMYPVAILSRDQKAVFGKHQIFYKVKKGWEKTTKEWLTPSGVMDVYRHYKIKYLIFSATSDAALAKKLHNDLSSHECVVTVFQDGANLKFLGPGKLRSWPIERYPRPHGGGYVSAKPFLDWLNSFADAGLECQFYVGRDFSIEEDVRLYAAFTKSANASDIIGVCNFAEILHEASINHAILRSLAGNILKLKSDFKWRFRPGDKIGQAIWRGQTYIFNWPQANVVDLLYEYHKKNTPWVSSATILGHLREKCITSQNAVQRVFSKNASGKAKIQGLYKNHDAWKNLIICHETIKGLYSLNI